MSRQKLVGCLLVLIPYLSLNSACRHLSPSPEATKIEQPDNAKIVSQNNLPEKHTKGIINYVCHWPGERVFAPLVNFDNLASFCSQDSCQMSSKDVLGVLTPGTRVVSLGGMELVKIRVDSGNFKNSTGYLAKECVDWKSDGKDVTGAPTQVEAMVDKGTYAERQAYAAQVNKENADARYYSGYKGNVTVSGNAGTTMLYYDPDTTKPEALTWDDAFISELRKKGFHNIDFKNGSGNWDIELKTEPPRITEK